MRTLIAMLLVAAMTCWVGGAIAADKTYASGEFKFSMNYPEKWKSECSKPEVEVSKSVFGVKIGTKVDARKVSKDIPPYVNACFAKKKCSPGDLNKGPEMHLMMLDVAAMKKLGQGKGQGKGKKDGGKAASANKGATEERDECQVVSRKKTRWAGRRATQLTMCCPDGKKKWRCTENISMKRRMGKADNMYTLMCTVQAKGKNDADAKQKALKKFNEEMKPVCDKARTSSVFLK